MNAVLFVCILFFLTVISWQDFRTRSVSVFSLIILAITCFVKAVQKDDIRTAVSNFLFVLSFEVFFIALLQLYFFIKNKKFSNIIDHKIGKGDLAFLISVSFVLSPMSFIALILISAILSIILTLALQVVLKSEKSLITNYPVPLAGIQSAVLFMLMVTSNLLKNDLSDSPFFQLMQLP